MSRIDFSLFFKANMLLTIVLGLLFLQFIQEYQLTNFFLTLFGIISTFALLYLVYYIILLPLSFFKKIALYVAFFIFLVTNIALIVDYFIFKMYKFHINAMVIDILTSPDALDSIQLGIAPISLFCFIVVLFLFFKIFILKKLRSTPDQSKTWLNKKLNRVIIIPFFLLILFEKISYGFASLHNHHLILSSFSVIPLYQPLTFNRLAAKYFHYKPEIKIDNVISHKGKLKYPLKDLQLCKDTKVFPIIIILSDSLRYSSLSPEVTPNLEAFKQDALNFQNHYSGGNSTRFGIFSLLYGLHSTYWFKFLNSAKGPVLFDVLKQLNYEISIISSTNTNWPEFRKTCYVDVQENIHDDFKGVPWEKDEQSAAYFIQQIQNSQKKKALFSFVFFDAPHGYSYPPQWNKFNATGENINYLTATKGSKETEAALARYKNSVAFNDHLFGEMVKTLKMNNLYDEALIIFTADHGQEFYEYGYFGHNSSFSQAQTQVPMLIKLPKKFQGLTSDTTQLTSHNDIVPTILDLLGVANPSSDYSNGVSLFHAKYARKYAFSANWNNNAIIMKNFTYVFSNLPNKMFQNEVRENRTYQKRYDHKIASSTLIEIMNENTKFIK